MNWREAPLRDPESAVLGSMYACDRAKHVDLVVTDPSAWVYAGTGLQAGDVIPGAIDQEYDRIFPGAPTPIEVFAHSPVSCHGSPSEVWCSAAATTITRTVLTEASAGRSGRPIRRRPTRPISATN